VNDVAKTIAVIGGTGGEGGGLALRFANAGMKVIIGSRDTARAEAAAASINAQVGTSNASGAANAAAAQAAEIVLLTVPYSGQQATALPLAPALQGKVLIDATVPLMPPRVGRVQLPEGDSAVANLQAALGAEVKVVAAFQNVSAHYLSDLDHAIDCDVLVCGDDAAACETAIELANAIGLRGVYAGPICNAAAVEALTSVLITINRRYKATGSGIRITGF
jgi:8-hydroxy-5-deazaflavin:NADPH oxidoreductase